MTSPAQPDRDVRRQGDYAGAVTRMSAYVVDLIVIIAGFTVATHAIEFLAPRVVGRDISLEDAPAAGSVALAIWAFAYLAYPMAVTGRTVGAAIMGLEVVRSDGGPLDGRHAVLRVLSFPLSVVLFGLGFLPILLRRDRRALHDLVAGTAVVYAWDARTARLRLLARQPPR